jgi:hypothetical protein
MGKNKKNTLEDMARYSDECVKEFLAFFEKEYVETGKTELWKAGDRLQTQVRKLDKLDRETRRARKALKALA